MSYDTIRMASLLFPNIILVLALVIVFSVAYYFRTYIALVLKVRPKKIGNETSRRENIVETSVEECPKCSQFMENGYILGGGFYWSREAPPYGHFYRGFFIGAEPLGSSSPVLPRAMRQAYFKAYRCRKCDIVNINLKEQRPFRF